MKRTLIVVTGPPCAGKTTLAAQLGHDLSLPVIHRDVLKEILFDTLGVKDRAWSRTLGGSSYVLLFSFLESLLKVGYPCIVETSFEPGRASTRLKALCETYDFVPLEILCTSNLETFHKRYKARLESGERHAGHVDHLNLDEISARWVSGERKSLDLGGQSIHVDTTDFGVPERTALVGSLQRVLWGNRK